MMSTYLAILFVSIQQMTKYSPRYWYAKISQKAKLIVVFIQILVILKNNYMIGLKNTKRLKNLIGMHGLILFYKDWLNKLYDIETCPSPNMVYAVRTFGVHQNTRLRQAHRIH